MWTAGGNIEDVDQIDELPISGEADDDQVAVAREAARLLVEHLGGGMYIVHLSGQDAPDHGEGQPHAPQAAIAVHVATTVPIA